MSISANPGSVLIVSVIFELDAPSFDVSKSENNENLTEVLMDSRHCNEKELFLFENEELN